MAKSKFKGDISSVIKLFKFEKVSQSAQEDDVHEFYQLKLKNGAKRVMIQIQIDHPKEEEDEITFECFIFDVYMDLNIINYSDLNNFIKIVS